MKKILIIILFIPLLIRGQNPVIYGGNNPLYALDLDGSTEYAYINNPSGLDLNSANYLSGDNTAFTSTIGNWVGLTQTSGKATFSSNATLSTSYLSTQFVSGHNYTIQLKAKSGSSSALKIKCGTDSTSVNTTTTETTYAFTFTYHSGSQIEFIGNGSDTYTIDDVDVSEAYDLEVEGWFKSNAQSASLQPIFHLGDFSQTRITINLSANNNYLAPYLSNGINGYNEAYLSNIVTFEYNKWQKLKFAFNRVNSIKFYLDGLLKATYNLPVSITSFGRLNYGSASGAVLQLGYYNSTRYFNGRIGWMKFTRKNGLGTVVNETKYDWKGSASTFLKDKKGSNNLTGVNVTLPDVVKYSQGKYK